jgi:hypothetical protein
VSTPSAAFIERPASTPSAERRLAALADEKVRDAHRSAHSGSTIGDLKSTVRVLQHAQHVGPADRVALPPQLVRGIEKRICSTSGSPTGLAFIQTRYCHTHRRLG